MRFVSKETTRMTFHVLGVLSANPHFEHDLILRLILRLAGPVDRIDWCVARYAGKVMHGYTSSVYGARLLMILIRFICTHLKLHIPTHSVDFILNISC